MANSFKRKTSAGIGTGFTPINSYTVASATEVTVIGLTVANVTSGSILADVSLHDGSNYFSVVKEAPIPSGGSLVVVGGDQKVVLDAGDVIQVKSNTATSADVVMSMLDIT